MTPRPATVSIDLDDLWSYRRSFGLPAAEPDISLLPVAIPRFLDFMQAHGIHGTAFVVGRDAALGRNAASLRAIAEAGHEVGNHSHEHAPTLESWPAERQREDLVSAHAAIEAATGQVPVGFRGPSFQVSRTLLEAVQLLGYRYDASTFPNALAAWTRKWQRRRAARLGTQAATPGAGIPGASQAPRLPLGPYAWDLPGGPLVEVPVTTLPGLRVPLHGTYLQYLADWSGSAARLYAGAAVSLCRRTGVDPHYLLHATDFIGSDDGFACTFLPGMRRPWQAKVALLSVLVRRLQDNFALMPIKDYVEQLGPVRQMVRRSPATLWEAA